MTDFKYTTVAGKLPPLLDKIRSIGVPDKATSKWLKSIGFTSSNDGSLLTVLKFIGFLEPTGAPKDFWQFYRGTDHREVLARAIRSGYSELFDVYSDAWDRTDSELDNFFRTRSTAGQHVINKTVSTFKALCSRASFDGVPSVPTSIIGEVHSGTPRIQHDGQARVTPVQPAGVGQSPSLHIDIQVHISPEATADQIDQIFASMARNLYGNQNDK